MCAKRLSCQTQPNVEVRLGCGWGFADYPSTCDMGPFHSLGNPFFLTASLSAILRHRPSRPGPRAPHIRRPPHSSVYLWRLSIVELFFKYKSVSIIVCNSATFRPRPSRPGPRAPHIRGPPTFQCLSMVD